MSNSSYVFYLISFLIQVAAALLVILLAIRVRFHKVAAILLATGLGLMAVRRLIPFQHFTSGWEFLNDDRMVDSLLSLSISVLLFLGLFGIRKSMSRLEDYTDLIENRSRTDYLTGAWN